MDRSGRFRPQSVSKPTIGRSLRLKPNRTAVSVFIQKPTATTDFGRSFGNMRKAAKRALKNWKANIFSEKYGSKSSYRSCVVKYPILSSDFSNKDTVKTEMHVCFAWTKTWTFEDQVNRACGFGLGFPGKTDRNRPQPTDSLRSVLDLNRTEPSPTKPDRAITTYSS